MYRFFVEPGQITGTEAVITGSDVNHIKNVLRMRIGEQLTLSDREDNDYVCSIAEITAERIVLRVLFKEPAGTELPAKLYLFQGLPKSDKMELIIQKAVELGAWEIIPVAAARSIVRLDEKKAQSRHKRWNAICESAAKQAKRGRIPQVQQVLDMKAAMRYAKQQELDLLLFPYELAEGMAQTRAAFGQVHTGMKIGIFIGPEGGFEESEVTDALACGARVISLGRRILRTETAGLAVLSALMLRLEIEQEEEGNGNISG